MNRLPRSFAMTMLLICASPAAWCDDPPPAAASPVESAEAPLRFGVESPDAAAGEVGGSSSEPIGGAAAARLGKEFGFGPDADYSTLLAALHRIQSVVREGGERADVAREARRLAMDYISESDRMRVQFDFVMAQPEYEHKAQGARVIAKLLAGGQPIDDTLRFKLIERLLHDLEVIRYRNANINAYVTAATQLLLILRDPRGLEVALTDQYTLQHLRLDDGWSEDDGAAMFRELAKAYAAHGKEVWHAARVGLYELIAWRVGQGKDLAPHEPRFDIRAYMLLPSD